MRTIYLDYNATTPVAPAVVEAMLPCFGEHYGNPSSAHSLGRAAQEAIGYRFSFDMLGEAAMTMQDADRYFAAYKRALEEVATKAGPMKAGETIVQRPSISVKPKIIIIAIIQQFYFTRGPIGIQQLPQNRYLPLTVESLVDSDHMQCALVEQAEDIE